ncbi:cyclopropane-fatty-acyl-phospholipid synthase [Trichoderma arundinaceum]|uniref:Cyclopropane-fatty-acyl-phospholipid synthase n=1 Tax=Trichoderma arundinaceum TaxID=490622 RepID=A0A395ND27_TRIAR|nr:cyclopropane-fatty-acyl-phospholipid synthase [Trichoderma arundinaceum]
MAKSSVLSVLSQIKIGSLFLIDEPSQGKHVFGQKCIKEPESVVADGQPRRRVDSIPQAELVIKKEEFWMRLFLFADMGFAEAYMLKDFECQDLTSFFQLFIMNRKQLNNGTTWLSKLSSLASNLARSTNTLSNALLNVSAHYDISNTMFAAFLSPDMTYSCPIWNCNQPNSDELLKSAQMRKLVYFIEGAKIQPSDHVLEIGTGWGSFAIEAVRRTGCRVTTITLSNEQKLLAEKRIEEAGLSDRIEVRLEDYRELPIPLTPYDKIVSIEMLEAVGQDYLATYFDRVHRLLKPKGGIAMFQCITMPEGRHEAYSKSKDFINRYIFPGGYLPSTTQILDHINRLSQGSLIIEKVENIGGHYAKTLRLWRESFLGSFEKTIRPTLLKEQPDMTQEGIQVFRRKWEYYFSYCEAGFLTKTLGDVIITVAREGSIDLMDKIPL